VDIVEQPLAGSDDDRVDHGPVLVDLALTRQVAKETV
jgi:hypothetical protein